MLDGLKLIRSLAGAINGSSIARGTSFLKDRLGQPVLPAGVDLGHPLDDAIKNLKLAVRVDLQRLGGKE